MAGHGGEHPTSEGAPVAPLAAWPRRSIALVSLGIVAGTFLVVSRVPLSAYDLVGYALCHRMPDHSFYIGGRQLPLCARCTGTYLGALWGLVFIGLIRRRRPSRLPPGPILASLFAFFLLYGADGVNSYLSLIPGLPRLYEPSNLLRLTTGALNGLTMSALILPLFSSALGDGADSGHSVRGWRDMLVLVAGAGGLVALVASTLPVLLYPVAVSSALSVLVVLTLVNAAVVLMASGREERHGSWGVARPVLLGVGLTVAEIAVLILMRGWLTNWLDAPL